MLIFTRKSWITTVVEQEANAPNLYCLCNPEQFVWETSSRNHASHTKLCRVQTAAANQSRCHLTIHFIRCVTQSYNSELCLKIHKTFFSLNGHLGFAFLKSSISWQTPSKLLERQHSSIMDLRPSAISECSISRMCFASLIIPHHVRYRKGFSVNMYMKQMATAKRGSIQLHFVI